MKNLKEIYRDNESSNLHSENLVLLAENFGNDNQISLAKEIITKRDKQGYLTPEQSDIGYNEIHLKLYKKLMKVKKPSKMTRREIAMGHLKEANIWAEELHTPTDISKGMTMNERDEKQAHHYRLYESNLKKTNPKPLNGYFKALKEAREGNKDSFKYKGKKYIRKTTKSKNVTLVYYKKSFWS